MKRMMAYFVPSIQSDFSQNANNVSKSQLFEELSPWALDHERSWT